MSSPIPFDVIREILTSTYPDAESSDRELSFNTGFGVTTLRLTEPVPGSVRRDPSWMFPELGEPVGVLTIDTKLPEIPVSLSSVSVAGLNTGSAMGALILDSDAEKVPAEFGDGDEAQKILHAGIHSKIVVFENDEDIWEFCLPLVVAAALTQAQVIRWIIASTLIPGGQIPGSIFPEGDQPSRWDEDELRTLQEWAEGSGIDCIVQEGEAILTIRGESGSGTLSITGDVVHPCIGTGLFSRYTPDLEMTSEQAANLANRLNRIEHEQPGSPPFFGAWCAYQDCTGPTFVSFIPNAAFRPGAARTVALWMIRRATVPSEIV